MTTNGLLNRNFKNEFIINSSRSSGPGGQNVNKVNTKIELRFNIEASLLLSDLEKHKIISKHRNKINSAGELIIVAQNHRSQLKNKEEAICKFYHLIGMALKPTKLRKATKPTRASVEHRLQSKRSASEKKTMRRKPDF